jgi:hypothetical protein
VITFLNFSLTNPKKSAMAFLAIPLEKVGLTCVSAILRVPSWLQKMSDLMMLMARSLWVIADWTRLPCRMVLMKDRNCEWSSSLRVRV